MRVPFVGELLRQHAYAGLADAVGAAVTLRVAAGDRRHVNNTAAALRAHLTAEDLRAEEIAGEVDRHHRVPFGERECIEPAGPQYRGSIDRTPPRPERFLDLLRRRR